jgi:hypothetical protein
MEAWEKHPEVRKRIAVEAGLRMSGSSGITGMSTEHHQQKT